MTKLKIGIHKTRLMQIVGEDLKKRILAAGLGLDEVEILLFESGVPVNPKDPEDFIKSLEKALLKKKIDLAVHLLKEIPVALPEKIELKAVSERMTPFDAFVSTQFDFLEDVPDGARVGVSHPRQKEQLGHFRPDLDFIEVHGSVDSRLQQMESQNLAGLILSAASLERLGLQDMVSEMITSDILLPGPGQGCLGILGLRDDDRWDKVHEFLEDRTARAETTAERAFLARLGEDQRLPLAALAAMDSESIRMDGYLGASDGINSIRDSVQGDSRFAEELGSKLAIELSLRLGGEGLGGLTSGDS